MTREETIRKLKHIAPVVTKAAATANTGCEFSAVVPAGVIYATPGMLIDYSVGKWPLDAWGSIPDKEFNHRLRDFLLDGRWEIASWDKLRDEEIDQWFDIATETRTQREALV